MMLLQLSTGATQCWQAFLFVHMAKEKPKAFKSMRAFPLSTTHSFLFAQLLFCLVI